MRRFFKNVKMKAKFRSGSVWQGNLINIERQRASPQANRYFLKVYLYMAPSYATVKGFAEVNGQMGSPEVTSLRSPKVTGRPITERHPQLYNVTNGKLVILLV